MFYFLILSEGYSTVVSHGSFKQLYLYVHVCHLNHQHKKIQNFRLEFFVIIEEFTIIYQKKGDLMKLQSLI